MMDMILSHTENAEFIKDDVRDVADTDGSQGCVRRDFLDMMYKMDMITMACRDATRFLDRINAQRAQTYS